MLPRRRPQRCTTSRVSGVSRRSLLPQGSETPRYTEIFLVWYLYRVSNVCYHKAVK